MRTDVIIVTLLMLATNVAEKWTESRTLKIVSTIAEGLVAISVFTGPLSKWILSWNEDTVRSSSLFRLDNYKELIAEAATPFRFTAVDIAQIEEECRAAIMVRDGLLNSEFDFMYTIIFGLMLLHKASKLGTRWTRIGQTIRMWRLFRDRTVSRNNDVAKILGYYDNSQTPRSLTAAQLGAQTVEIFFCMKSLTIYSVIAGQWVQVTCPVAGSDTLTLEKKMPPRCKLRYTLKVDPGTLLG